MESIDGIADGDALAGHSNLADSSLVLAAAFFQYRDGLPNGPSNFEVAEEHDAVRQIGKVGLCVHHSEHALLGEDHQARHAFLTEVGEQFMQLKIEKSLFGHGIEISVNTVDANHVHATIDRRADAGGEFAR